MSVARVTPTRALALLLLLVGLAPLGCSRRRAEGATLVPYAEARAIVDRHCISCHSASPTNPAFPIAPNDVTLETLEGLRRHATKVRERTLAPEGQPGSMPLLNRTAMTEAERSRLVAWVDGGAEAP